MRTSSRLVLRRRVSAILFVSTLLAGGVAACDDDETSTPGPSGADSGADATTGKDAGGSTDSSSAADVVVAADANTTDAADAASTDGGAGDATTGGPYALVYSGTFNGIDSRIVTATLSADGKILGYDAGSSESPFVITARVDDAFADAFANIGRWTNGTVGGAFYDDAGVKTLSATESQHLGVARVPSTMPASGTGTYTLLASTSPQIHDGTQDAGAVTAGSFKTLFNGATSTALGFELTLQMPDGTYNVVGGGGATTPDDGGAGFDQGGAGFRMFAPSVTTANDAGLCSGLCTSGAARVVFAGPNAERAIVAYVFNSGSLASGRRGVAIFQKQ